MKRFCTRCGAANEVAAEAFTCTQCGAASGAPAPGTPLAAKAPPPKKGMAASTIVIIIGAVLAVPCFIGILAAIAIPNFIRFQARSKQSECKSNLKMLYTAQRSFFAENDAYSSYLGEVGFSPERGNRYAYFLTPQGELEDRSQASVARDAKSTGIGVDRLRFPQASDLGLDQLLAAAPDLELGVVGQCPDCAFTAACAGNIDSDDTLDVWSISSEERRTAGGQTVPAGVPHNDVNDVTD